MIVANRESIDQLISKANQCIDQAEKELDITNRNGFHIDESYTEAQRNLGEIEQEIQNMMNSASHEQRDRLHRIHLRVSQYMNDMILDRVDTTHFTD
ncbi:YtzC family protein [Radiobacillus kanasensis]|uniref:DUF2524 family protein n=1 Tax=Radiobacillus kanasensis TaxID=2844358 RepID=UPI001E405BA8|nr:DUF2524 family protein [Radiobacillus kanasensis]UFT98163.1 YtzC family protein [Radiobacillus kanasensis]